MYIYKYNFRYVNNDKCLGTLHLVDANTQYSSYIKPIVKQTVHKISEKKCSLFNFHDAMYFLLK